MKICNDNTNCLGSARSSCMPPRGVQSHHGKVPVKRSSARQRKVGLTTVYTIHDLQTNLQPDLWNHEEWPCSTECKFNPGRFVRPVSAQPQTKVGCLYLDFREPGISDPSIASATPVVLVEKRSGADSEPPNQDLDAPSLEEHGTVSTALTPSPLILVVVTQVIQRCIAVTKTGYIPL